jgi:hypothetical protein
MNCPTARHDRVSNGTNANLRETESGGKAQWNSEPPKFTRNALASSQVRKKNARRTQQLASEAKHEMNQLQQRQRVTTEILARNNKLKNQHSNNQTVTQSIHHAQRHAEPPRHKTHAHRETSSTRNAPSSLAIWLQCGATLARPGGWLHCSCGNAQWR